MEASTQSILALDIGDRRIGVALADTLAKLAHPLITIDNTDDAIKQIKNLTERYNVAKIIVGLPRNLDGHSTAQTEQTLKFVNRLKSGFDLPVLLQDEALTSVLAEKELASRKTPYKKADIDALAATYILDDYLASDLGPERV
jgi:putative Holliday junction resolvase